MNDFLYKLKMQYSTVLLFNTFKSCRSNCTGHDEKYRNANKCPATYITSIYSSSSSCYFCYQSGFLLEI